MANPEFSDSLIAFLAKSRKATSGSDSWSESYRKRDFLTALSAVETAISESPDSVECRLWWTLIQLEIGSVPLGALASPLVELLPALRENRELSELAIHVALSLAGKLSERGQLRLGATLAEAAYELGTESDEISAQEKEDLRNYSIHYYEEELSRARNRRESKEYIARIEKRIEERKSLALSLPSETKKPRTRKNSLNSKALFEQALSQEIDDSKKVDSAVTPAVSDGGGAMGVQSKESLSTKDEHGSFEPFVLDHSPKRWRPFVTLSAGAALLLVPLIWGKQLREFFHPTVFGEPGLLLAMNTSGPALGTPLMPSLELNGHDVLSRKMQNINSSLAQVGERLRNIGEKPAADSEVDQAALAASEQQLSKVEKKSEDELVPLDGPKQPVEARLDPRKTPRLEPNEVKNTPVEDLGRAPLPRDEAPQLKVGADGRLYGPPSDQDPAAGNRSSEARALDGSPLRSYEVHDFSNPKLYRTIVATNVLSAPSLLSVAVTRLEPNTSIQVVSHMGQWLELRSTQGRRGYIFAQDAVEVGEQENRETH